MKHALKGVDQYEQLHELLRAGKYAIALTHLLDKEQRRLRSRFRFDANHSWYLAGDIFWNLGLVKSACSAFKKSLRSWPEDVEAILAVGNCYSELGRPRLTERYLRRALTFDKKNYSIYYNLGNALYDQGKYGEAIRCYKVSMKGNRQTRSLAKKNLALVVEMCGSTTRRRSRTPS